MNKYYDNNEQFNSNKRIFEVYFTEIKKEPTLLERMGNILSWLFAALTSARARGIAKAMIVIACLIGFVGLIGAIEQGFLSIGTGLLLSVPLLIIEVLCFKKRIRYD